jgi:hypothetical protein
MLAILSSIMGFATAGLPNILSFFQQRGDQAHEREMAKLQTERELQMAEKGFIAQQKIEEIKLDEINAETYTREREALYQHDQTLINKASQSVVDLNAKVRPYVAFIFVGELVAINFISLAWAMYTGVDFITASHEVFSTDEMAIVGSIIGFYFGSRTWEKK